MLTQGSRDDFIFLFAVHELSEHLLVGFDLLGLLLLEINSVDVLGFPDVWLESARSHLFVLVVSPCITL